MVVASNKSQPHLGLDKNSMLANMLPQNHGLRPDSHLRSFGVYLLFLKSHYAIPQFYQFLPTSQGQVRWSFAGGRTAFSVHCHSSHQTCFRWLHKCHD